MERPPIVTIMGHVDHGKTTLLDYFRKSSLAAKEPGQITQSIGAYQVDFCGKKITFIDTPGHEAFMKMRQRGVMATDIVILVVAANDGIMPQTKESIEIIKGAKVPFIVALNKVDLPEANLEKTKKQLADQGVNIEEFGGDVICVEISAKTGQGVDKLLKAILALAEILELKAETTGEIKIAVLESKMDKARGLVVSGIVKNGTIEIGQEIKIDGFQGKIRGLFEETGKAIKNASAGMPVGIIGLAVTSEGFEGVGGFEGTGTDEEEKEMVETELPAYVEEEKKLQLIIKADCAGSLEAIVACLQDPKIKIIATGIGEINESDVLSAKAHKANIVGFNVKTNKSAAFLAKTENISVSEYQIIYELLKDCQDLSEVIKKQGEIGEEIVLGEGVIIAEFPYEKTKVCGTKIVKGRIARGDSVRITRGEEEVGKCRVKSVRHGKEDIPKAEMGVECGLLLDTEVDFLVGDGIISYKK